MIYRVEIRTDVEAESKDAAYEKAQKLAAAVDGQVTEVLDEDWNEV